MSILGTCYSFNPDAFNTLEAQKIAQQEYMRCCYQNVQLIRLADMSTNQNVILLFRSIFSDTIGFAGAEMIRRIVGQLDDYYCLRTIGADV